MSGNEIGIFNNVPHEGVAMNRHDEILTAANPFYEKLPAGLIDVNCGDGRGLVELLPILYGKKFGGGAGYSWDYMVLHELVRPGSIVSPLPDIHEELVLKGHFEKAAIRPGVHSDEHAEGHGATAIDLSNTDGPVGCGRWQKGQEISKTALQAFDLIFTKACELAPSVFNIERRERAQQIASINEELARRKTNDGRPLLPAGREIVLAALETGDTGVVLAGEHTEKDAVYNLVENQTNNNQKSQDHFGADGWLNNRFFAANNEAWQFDPTDVLMQDVMVALATKLVLTGSLEDVAVRAA